MKPATAKPATAKTAAPKSAAKPSDAEIPEIHEPCQKAPELCICDQLKPVANRKHVLVLQHPQEPDKELGTARIATLQLKRSTLKTGLSWRSLKAILDKDGIDPKRWGVLYLGAGTKTKTRGRTLIPVDSKGVPHPEPLIDELLKKLDGIVVIDGTWSQAKTLWWRNAFLLKSQRLVLQPKTPSLYGKLRKEPRGECLSTIESIAEALDALGEDPAVGTALRASFSTLLGRYRQVEFEKRQAKRAAKEAGANASDAISASVV